MGRKLEDMGENDQHTLGIWVSETDAKHVLMGHAPVVFQPYIVETGKALDIVSLTVGESVNDAIKVTLEMFVSAVKFKYVREDADGPVEWRL